MVAYFYLHSAQAWLQSCNRLHSEQAVWKLIFLVLIVWLVINIAKRMLANSNTQPKSTPAHESQQHSAENMVQCKTCQIHLPRSEAFMVDGQFYCSHAHIQRHKP